MIVTKAISYYLNNYICLSQKDISACAASRDWLLKRVENVINSRQGEPKLYSGKYGDKFLYFGSYFKGTKVADVDEYDVLVLIDSNSGQFSRSGQKVGTGQGTAEPNPKYYKKFFKDDNSGVSPSKMLNWFKGIVEEVIDVYSGEAPIRDGQAITATVKSKDLKIDLVPAGVFLGAQGNAFYNIPDGTSANSWITTSPKIDIDKLNALAKGRNDFKNVIRIVKRIKDTYNLQLSSFPIEMAAVHYVTGTSGSTWFQDLYTDTTGLIRAISASFRAGEIADIYNDNQNLLKDVENLNWYADRLEGIADNLAHFHSKLTDEDEAKIKVAKLFENDA